MRDETFVYVFGPPEPVLVEWPKKDWELAAEVEHDIAQKRGRDPTTAELTAGLEQACQTYQNKNGEKFKVKNLRDGLRQQKNLIEDQKYPRLRVRK
jgi:hypothetical protein